jgi:hypothetical protein
VGAVGRVPPMRTWVTLTTVAALCAGLLGCAGGEQADSPASGGAGATATTGGDGEAAASNAIDDNAPTIPPPPPGPTIVAPVSVPCARLEQSLADDPRSTFNQEAEIFRRTQLLRYSRITGEDPIPDEAAERVVAELAQQLRTECAPPVVRAFEQFVAAFPG